MPQLPVRRGSPLQGKHTCQIRHQRSYKRLRLYKMSSAEFRRPMMTEPGSCSSTSTPQKQWGLVPLRTTLIAPGPPYRLIKPTNSIDGPTDLFLKSPPYRAGAKLLPIIFHLGESIIVALEERRFIGLQPALRKPHRQLDNRIAY